MAIKVDGAAHLRDWANSKSCEQWKTDRSCGHDGCIQAQRAVDVLTALHETSPGQWSLTETDVNFTA